MKKLSVAAIVPARAGSKRLPGKNRVELGGRPLFQWALELALNSKRFCGVVASSDDEAILDYASHLTTHLSGIVALRRPECLSNDKSLAIDYVLHALENWTSLFKDIPKPDALMILQPTSPFTRVEDIEKAISLLQGSQAESVVSLMELPHAFHPTKAKVLNDGIVSRWGPLEQEPNNEPMAAHELDKSYVRNGSIYLTRRSVLERGQLIGQPCLGFVMPPERSIDINDALDLELARILFDKQGKK